MSEDAQPRDATPHLKLRYSYTPRLQAPSTCYMATRHMLEPRSLMRQERRGYMYLHDSCYYQDQAN